MVKRHAAAAALFIVLAIAMTWPLAPNLSRAIDSPGDPLLNSWILDWDWYATFHRPMSLFDANIFYPARYSLAYSENLFGIAMFLFPLRAAGVAPITAHNIAILGGFAFSGYAAWLLGRLITGSSLAGMTAGIFYAFVPFRFTHLPHVQHVWGGTLPLLLAALLYYARNPTWLRAALFAGAFLLNGLANIHYLLFGSIAIALTIPIVRSPLVRLAACAGVAMLLLAPFLYPYFAVAKMYGMERSWQETMSFSARASDWMACSINNRFYVALHDTAVDPELWLFPGALAILLAAFALISHERRSLAIASAWITLGFIGSLGLHTFLHRFFFTYFPGFRAIRVPARWAVIVYVGLSMLVALATAMLARRQVWIAPVLAIALLIELRAAPIRWYMAQTTVPPVEQWIAHEKPRAVIELPLIGGREYSIVFWSTAHHRPIVNGISGFTPPEYRRINRQVDAWSDALIPELARLGVSHVIVQADWMDASGRAWLARALARREINFVRRFDREVQGDWAFSIGGPSRSSPDLQAMLRGEPTYSDATIGTLFYPQWGERLNNRVFFSGFAFSRYGIREVNLLFNAGQIRLPTLMAPDAALSRQYHWYSATTKPRFFGPFSKRPPGVWERTDVQVEIIDGRGARTLLEDRFIEWP